jgi:hypothetical protein
MAESVRIRTSRDPRTEATIETRPGSLFKAAFEEMLSYGCTRIEIASNPLRIDCGKPIAAYCRCCFAFPAFGQGLWF